MHPDAVRVGVPCTHTCVGARASPPHGGVMCYDARSWRVGTQDPRHGPMAAVQLSRPDRSRISSAGAVFPARVLCLHVWRDVRCCHTRVVSPCCGALPMCCGSRHNFMRARPVDVAPLLLLLMYKVVGACALTCMRNLTSEWCTQAYEYAARPCGQVVCMH